MSDVFPLLPLALALSLSSVSAEPPTKNSRGKNSAQQSDLSTSPRPLMMRANWTALDSTWDFAIAKPDAPPPDQWTQKIRVPAPVGSAMSGIESAIPQGQAAWYRLEFDAPTLDTNQSLFLHFNAIRGDAQVMLNGQLISFKQDSLAPFSINITRLLADSKKQDLTVVIQRANDSSLPHAIGITGMPWLERVPRSHLKNLQVSSDPDSGEVTVFAGIWGQANFRELEVIAMDGKDEIAKGSAFYHYKKRGYQTTLKIPEPIHWSPSSPKLYGLRIRLANEDGSTHDEVASYFAIRKVSRSERAGAEGSAISLNGEPLFLLGIDDSRITFPSDAPSIRRELDALRSMGFNLIRFTSAMASPLYRHWADRSGMLVWQGVPIPEPPASPMPAETSTTAPPPPETSAQTNAVTTLKEHFAGHPSIVIWPPTPESRSAAPAPSLGHAIAAAPVSPTTADTNATDLIYPAGTTGLVAMPDPTGNQELALAAVGVAPGADGWNQQHYSAAVDQIKALASAGIDGITFAQRPDKELKAEWLAEMNARLTTANSSGLRPSPLLAADATWRFTGTAPGDGWQSKEFDDSAWKSGQARFGLPKSDGRSAWPAGDSLWLRTDFEYTPEAGGQVFLRIDHSGRSKCFVNGTLVHAGDPTGSSAILIPLDAQATELLAPGKNFVAIEISGSSEEPRFAADLIIYRP